ncbi:MAG: TIGR01620 family protein [Rhodobacteraceae bacterium]|nr:TIGR01620 family protein [Paracoccaceae bacterium]
MTDTPGRKGPVLIEMPGPSGQTPASAPPVPDLPAEGPAMAAAAGWAARPGSRLGRFFWASGTTLLGFVASVAAWRFVTDLLAANPVLGWIAAALVAIFVLASALIALREYAAYARLGRLDALHKAASVAGPSGDLQGARKVVDGLSSLYRSRPDLAWGLERLKERLGDTFDADAMLSLAETELLAPLDMAARAEIEAASRRVATVTAIVPLALADVATALVVNLRMIRRIAEIYGGRAGTFGSWRLLRTVMGHLVATGAVAVGDDLIQSVAGGGLLSKISRRFGEGVVNGALTARVGVAAMEVCRPLPFVGLPKPKVGNLVTRGLAGLFGTTSGTDREASNS